MQAEIGKLYLDGYLAFGRVGCRSRRRRVGCGRFSKGDGVYDNGAFIRDHACFHRRALCGRASDLIGNAISRDHSRAESSAARLPTTRCV